MRLAVFTQDERLFLPIAIGTLVEQMADKISCIILAPPMSTHGGAWKGAWKHLGVFGVRGVAAMAGRLAIAHSAPKLGIPAPEPRKYWSIREVGERFNIPTLEVEKVNSREMAIILEKYPADLLVSVSCPQVVRKRILGKFPKGGINVHSAPLPLYRGLMPGFWVLHHGETETAVTVHDLASKLDNGEILVQKPVPIDPGETWSSLILKTKTAAGLALVEAVEQIENGTVQRRPNPDEGSTYFSFPTWKDGWQFRRGGGRMT